MAQRQVQRGRGSSRDGGQHRGRKGRRTKEMVLIARERMDLLMVQALQAARSGDMTKADRYAGLARGIGMRYNVRLRPEHRQLICRSCGALLIPSKTSTIRVRHGRRILHCIRCGDIRRIPLKILNKKANLDRNPPPDDEISTNDDL